MTRTILLILALGTALATCGCGDGRLRVYHTRGKVLDAAGKPLVGATVLLHPVGSGVDAAIKPGGVTDQDGVFVLTTYTHGDGAPAGDYAATIECRLAPKGPADDPPDLLNGQFRDPANSPFKFTVKKGDNDLPAITLTAPKARPAEDQND